MQKNTAVSTAAQETDAVGSANAGKTDSDSSIEIDPDMQVLPDGYEVATDADGNLIATVGDKEYNIGSEKSQKQTGTVVPGITSLHFRSGPLSLIHSWTSFRRIWRLMVRTQRHC